MQRPKDKEQQYSDQKTKSNNTATKDKEQQYSDQKTKNYNTATKRQRTTIP